jgi:PAS domain S-box-containing protein
MTSEESILQNLTLEQVLETVPSGLFVVDREMRIVYWNPTAETITGFSAEEATGQHCSFLKGVPCGNKCGLYDFSIPKPIISAPCTVITKSGETIHLLKNVQYLHNAEGEVIGGIESFNDVTQQHQLEESLRDQGANLEARILTRTAELKESEQRFRSVLDNMDDMAYIASEDHILTFMNRAMLELFGDRIGEHCYEVLHRLNAVCSWCPMDNILKQRTVRDERQFVTADRIYEVIHSPLPPEGGKRQKLAICRDITERKKAEMELREANRELDAFTHSISHDMRGILSPVVTYMDFLRLRYGGVFDQQVLQILGEVEHQSERAIALLDDLLDLAQVSHIGPGDRPTDVNAIVEEVKHELSVGQKELPEILCEKLPDSWLPESLVYQVVHNLLNNACHYVPLDSGPIEIGHWDENDRSIYFVRDHGPGIQPEEREKVFDIFYRGKSSKGQRGTGVGLAIVRKIALRCNGEAWVEQTPCGGATFCIALPKKSVFAKPADTV